MNTKILRSLGVLLATSFCSMAQAGVINFDDLALSDYDQIPANYADHGLGGNGDAHVGVTYSGDNGATNFLGFWTTDYGDLSKVAYTPNDGNARINFTADSGWLIDSIEFDLAGWPGLDWQADVLIGLGAAVQTSNAALILGSSHSHFTFSGAGAQSAFIQWGTTWNVGIDNIVFNVRSVPEPGTLALLGLGLFGLGLTRRKAH